MIVHCPQCQARYSLDETRFGGQARLQLRCTKCQVTFPVDAPTGTKPGALTTEPPGSSDATRASATGGRPWLPEGKVVSLIVTQGPLTGKIFSLTKPSVLLGRREMDIVLDDSDVSRKHCALEVHGSTALLVDLGSTNGTFVDEQKIETWELTHLSEFRIGASTVMFSIRDKA